MAGLPDNQERAILVGTKEETAARRRRLSGLADGDYELEELSGLVETAGAKVVGTLVRRREKPDSALFIGEGKIGELKDLIRDLRGDVVVFDDELTPVQNRNLEMRLGKKVLDRTGVILDIFALRARTKERRVGKECSARWWVECCSN